MAVGFDNTTDPKKAAANQRAIITQRADQLNQQNQDLGNHNADLAADHQGFLDPIEQQMAAGQGGYNPDETAAIEGKTGPNGLDNLPTSQSDLQGNFLTGGEQAGMKGDTGSYGDYFDPEGLHNSLVDDYSVQDAATGDLKQGLGNAINPNNLKQSQGYADAMHNQILDNQGNVHNALSGEGTGVRGAIDPAALKQDAGAAKTEVMTPEQEQQMVTAAGVSAGARNSAAVGTLQRQALAAGSSPMGVAAYRARMNQQSAAEAGDAMTQARVQAQQARAGEALSSEQQRLAAQGKLTDVQTGTELDLGKQQVAGEQQLGQQALTQANVEEQNRQAAEQYLTGAQMQAATTTGEAEMQNAQNKTAGEQAQNQYVTNTGTAIRQAQDTANTARAGQVATNRQAVGEGNQQTQFNQGNTVNQEGSQRATTVGNARLGQQNTGLGLQAGVQGQENANAQGAYGRDQQTYSTEAGGGNQAANLTQAASQNPTTFDKVMGAVTGVASGAAAFMDEGGVATKPTLAVIGEHGPEKVVPMGSPYRARMAQMQAPPPKRRPMRYGQEVA